MVRGFPWSGRAERATPWEDLRFVVMDFETTGLRVRRARPLSVGWVPVRDGRAVLADAGYRRIGPGGPVPTASMGIHGLLPEDLEDAAPPQEVGEQLATVLDGHLLVAHGVFLEVGMLAHCGVDVARRQVVDTMGLAASLDRLDGRPGAADRSLGGTAARLGLPVLRPHHAFGDALTTAGLFLALAAGLGRHGADSRGALLRLSRPR